MKENRKLLNEVLKDIRHDMTDEERHAVRQFFRDKEALNKELRQSGKMPPFDSITMVGGGHDNRLYAQEDFGIKLLKAFEDLEHMRVGNVPEDI